MAGEYDERVRVRTGAVASRPIAPVGMPRHLATVGGLNLEGSCIHVKGFEITAKKPATAIQLRASRREIVDNCIQDMMVGVSGTVGKPSPDDTTRDYSEVTHDRIAYNKIYRCEYGFMLGGENWLLASNEVSRLWMYARGRWHSTVLHHNI